MATQIGPVCSMQVDEKQSPAQSQYQAQTYHFCSQGCKAKLDQNPQQHARGTGQAQ
jgi:P-type Cu+ transporter